MHLVSLSLTYDRLGRGDSTDTAPYALEREVEDVPALINEVGGPVYLYVTLQERRLQLQAATTLRKQVRKLAIYEGLCALHDDARKAAKEYNRPVRPKVLAPILEEFCQ